MKILSRAIIIIVDKMSAHIQILKWPYLKQIIQVLDKQIYTK